MSPSRVRHLTYENIKNSSYKKYHININYDWKIQYFKYRNICETEFNGFYTSALLGSSFRLSKNPDRKRKMATVWATHNAQRRFKFITLCSSQSFFWIFLDFSFFLVKCLFGPYKTQNLTIVLRWIIKQWNGQKVGGENFSTWPSGHVLIGFFELLNF